ncbi:hypothetical protein [Pseudovibrio sp. Tun.PSC04-5.I4]|uniref:hypothetical protein n=1 Tax=Pseudovibrio sp. Tun.PSC04-5.I4 TaxID=1798213 RepID=UPI0008872A7D|nr:hypothetical protein [Pseudovibrio sp. Tun.PSC04-5.I4]SDR34721.1 hypothetical protein SAMN04515695_4770 [Pseudovibrio sp. Tun.PSC04-5.I4]
MSITFKLFDETGLSEKSACVWVAGWINGGSFDAFKVLDAEQFSRPSATTPPSSVPFQKLSDVSQVILSDVTNGDDRLLFVVSTAEPDALTTTNNNPIQFTQYPFANVPSIASPGPFDVFEFGLNAQLNLTAVSGFGLNLRFTVQDEPLQEYGVRSDVSRAQIAKAFEKFIRNEAKSDIRVLAFKDLLYSAPLTPGGYQPPVIDDQFFAICDPNDWLASSSGNYQGTTNDPLSTYWDETLAEFFKLGNRLSINLGSSAALRLYEGSCKMLTHPTTNAGTLGFSLSGPQGTYQYFKPESGLQSSQYVFQQSFGAGLTPAGPADDAGLLQDCIWEALCRGVAQNGVQEASETTSLNAGFSTEKWNDWTQWYKAGKICHSYSKFLHYSDVDGTDSRLSGKPSIFLRNAVYGFSMDENPIGPYDGPEVPSKTRSNISSGTVNITVGAWN